MQLSEVESLKADFHQDEVKELVAVTQSTRLSSPSAILRYGQVPPEELEIWLEKATVRSLHLEFKLGRIADIQNCDELPKVTLAERLVIRDVDLEHLGGDIGRLPPGRVVAHADYRFHPAYGTKQESKGGDDEIDEPAPSPPTGFNQELHRHTNERVSDTMTTAFHGLPCFELNAISTLSPSHLRRGLGKKLTEWIFPYADQLNLPVVLSASPMGLPLYEKCGFVEYNSLDVVVRLEEWGGDGIHKLVTMVRWPEGEGRLAAGWETWRNTHHNETSQSQI